MSVYDRTGLINETVGTLSESLREELIITAVVIVLFLLHVRASLIVAVTLPMAVLMSFIGMQVFKIDANIMSLAGIAIAIGEVADLGIIISENIYQHLVEWEKAEGRDPRRRSRTEVIIDATHEVAGAVITGVSTTIVSFLPVFFLTGRDLKLFAPLAWTKTFAMFAALLVAVFLVPALCRLLLQSSSWPRWRGWLVAGVTGMGGVLATVVFWRPWLSELSSLPLWATAPARGTCAWDTGNPHVAGAAAADRGESHQPHDPVGLRPDIAILAGAQVQFCRDSAPHHRAGGGSLVRAADGAFSARAVCPPVGCRAERRARLRRRQASLSGAANGRLDRPRRGNLVLHADALSGGQLFAGDGSPADAGHADPRDSRGGKRLGQNRPGRIGSRPAPSVMIETYVMLKPEKEWREGITIEAIWDQINAVGTLPGVTPASPLQPIEGRVVMLQSGIKAPMAIRVYGDRLDGLADAARQVAERLKKIPYVNAATVNPDIVLGMPYVEFEVDREVAARFGMTTKAVNEIIETALGGMNLTQTVEGRERYPIRVRYQRDLRERIDDLSRLPIVTETGEVVPLELLARMSTTWGPGMISSEDARLVAHIAFAPSGMAGDLETVEAVEAQLRQDQQDETLVLPAGYSLEPVGSFQNQIEANYRLMTIIPIVILVDLLIIYLNFRNLPLTLIIFSQIPIAIFGGMIGLGLFAVEMNTAIWIGLIALIGIAEDDGVVIATYMEQLFGSRPMRTVADLREATVEAGRRRIRPCLMTAFTTFAALLPVMLATGRGADVARAMALPVFFGMFIELISLFVVPVLYCGYMEWKLQLAGAPPVGLDPALPLEPSHA